MTRPRASVSFSWHRAACSTNAALDLQCRSPRSTSRKEPGDSPELAEIREAKDPSVVRNRGPRASRRHAGALPSHGHHPSDLGLRVAELLALRVQDVDFLRRTVRVEFQTTPDGKYRVPPKTPRSRRTVPLPELVSKALAMHIAEFPPTDDGSLFTTANGNLYRHEHYGARIFGPAVKKAELPAGTTSHSLRHHYASVLLAAGESVVAVAERLGHENATLVLKTYGHLVPDSEDRTRRATDDAWTNDGTQTESDHR